MQTEPQADAFAKRYGRGEAQVVWTTLVADLETPVSAFLKIAGGRPMMFYRDQNKARADWLNGWREFFEEQFPAQVAAIDTALGTTPSEDDDEYDDGNDVA